MTERDLVETIEVPPQELGWRPLGNREWVHEDGRKIIFAPGARQVFLKREPMREGHMFTERRKLQCIEREIKQRQAVYGRLVDEGRMTPKQAGEEIAIMREIADDYRAQIRDLFNEPPSVKAYGS